MVPRGDSEGQLNMDKYLSPKDVRNMSEGAMYALVAAEEALQDAGWKPTTIQERRRTGLYVVL